MSFEWIDIHLKNKFGTFFKIQNYYLQILMLFMQFNTNYLFIFSLTNSAHSTIRNISFIFQISIGNVNMFGKENKRRYKQIMS